MTQSPSPMVSHYKSYLCIYKDLTFRAICYSARSTKTHTSLIAMLAFVCVHVDTGHNIIYAMTCSATAQGEKHTKSKRAKMVSRRIYNKQNTGKCVVKEGRKCLFNDALNTFYLRLYGVRHMVKDHSDSEKGNPLPPHGLLFPFNSKGSFICIIPHT